MPDVLICLGQALELHCGEFVYKWSIRDNMRLYSTPTGQKLYLLKAKPKKSSEEQIRSAAQRNLRHVEQGLKLYEDWHDAEAAGGSLLDIPKSNVIQLGRCSMILYRSDKWTGKQTRYYHEFKTPPLLWATSKSAPIALILSGGKIRIKKEGITG